MKSALAFVPALIVLGTLYSLDALTRLWRRHRIKNRRSPLTAKLLRGPGQSLRDRIDDLQTELVSYLWMATLGPTLSISTYLLTIYQSKSPYNPFALTILVVGAGFLAYGAFQVFRLKPLIETCREGLDGEIAVGQQLNQLLKEGFSVFHDIQGDGFNIDHVVVGRTGVFAVETKMRRKPVRGKGAGDAEVVYDDRCLRFPDWTDKQAVDQASRQGKRLSKWLSAATGDTVNVRPVIALPGWFVHPNDGLANNPNSVLVMNPTALFYFSKKVGPELSEGKVKRIVYQLDRCCRDVEPFAKTTDLATAKKESPFAKAAKDRSYAREH